MALATTLDRTQVADIYRQMQTIRIFEEFSQVKYQEQKIKGFLHLYIGQEAVAVGAISALRPDDDVITSYRDHGHALAKGLDPNAIMAELYGKATGVSGGKGGSMHLFDTSKRFWGGHAIVAGPAAPSGWTGARDQDARRGPDRDVLLRRRFGERGRVP